MADRTPESYRCQIAAQEQCLQERDAEIERLRATLEEYKAVDAEYHQQIRLNNERLRAALSGLVDAAEDYGDHAEDDDLVVEIVIDNAKLRDLKALAKSPEEKPDA